MKSKKWQKTYKEIEQIGDGGNAIVYKVSLDNKEFALKEQINLSKEKKQRFSNEIQIVLNEQENCSGILPIYDHSADKDNGFWYTMPIAQPIDEVLQDRSLSDIVIAIIEIADTLKNLHEKQISHRDIKPDNMFYFNGCYCLGDFGLVDYPESENLTKTKSHLGAWSTMAPEMRRNPKCADGKKADVYSLAKTLWILATKNFTGFDGEYSFLNQSIALNCQEKSEYSIVDLHELLLDATKNNPDERPDMQIFSNRMKKWLKEKDNWQLSQQKEWAFIIKQLFILPPERAYWNTCEDIVKILNIIAKTNQLSHMLLPSGGGIDLENASKSFKEGFIFLNKDAGTLLLKPKLLTMESFGKNSLWNYFLLEIEDLHNIDNSSKITERLALLPKGEEVISDGVEYGVFDYDSGKKLPDGYKMVNKYLKGNILFVLKSGHYNQIPATYDARHGFCGPNKFREYIKKLKDLYDLAISKGCTPEGILGSDTFSKNILSSKQKMTLPSRETNEVTDDFLTKKYKNWDFSDCIDDKKFNNKTPIKFFIEFKNPVTNIVSYRSLFSNKKRVICRDGRIRELNFDKSDVVDKETLFIDDRASAITTCNECIAVFDNICKQKGFSNSFNYFHIELQRNFDILPSHLFTREEVEKIIHEADDRVCNCLVIDENGYAKIIQSDDYFLYPVRYSQWGAGNNYVGKYANLSDSYIDEIYKYCLWGWLNYLSTGETQYTSDLFCDKNPEKILEEIETFYHKG